MGMAGDYIKAHAMIAKIVEDSFRKMSKHCLFNEINEEKLGGTKCLYKGAEHCCAREICPVLEKE